MKSPPPTVTGWTSMWGRRATDGRGSTPFVARDDAADRDVRRWPGLCLGHGPRERRRIPHFADTRQPRRCRQGVNRHHGCAMSLIPRHVRPDRTRMHGMRNSHAAIRTPRVPGPQASGYAPRPCCMRGSGLRPGACEWYAPRWCGSRTDVYRVLNPSSLTHRIRLPESDSGGPRVPSHSIQLLYSVIT